LLLGKGDGKSRIHNSVVEGSAAARKEKLLDQNLANLGNEKAASIEQAPREIHSVAKRRPLFLRRSARSAPLTLGRKGMFRRSTRPITSTSAMKGTADTIRR
jgi:hypothetical protein